jgi:hypothetical protein
MTTTTSIETDISMEKAIAGVIQDIIIVFLTDHDSANDVCSRRFRRIFLHFQLLPSLIHSHPRIKRDGNNKLTIVWMNYDESMTTQTDINEWTVLKMQKKSHWST